MAHRKDGQPARGAGHLLVQPFVEDADKTLRKLDDVCGDGFLLLADSDEPFAWLDIASQSLWERIKGRSFVVAPEHADPSPGGYREQGRLFADMLQAFEARVVLTRPDKYVFGVASDAQELNALMSQLAAGLHGTPG